MAEEPAKRYGVNRSGFRRKGLDTVGPFCRSTKKEGENRGTKLTPFAKVPPAIRAALPAVQPASGALTADDDTRSITGVCS